METLLTESMISSFSSSGLLLGSFFRKRSSETAGNFSQNRTQLELIEYHASRSLVSIKQSMDLLSAPRGRQGGIRLASPALNDEPKRCRRSWCRDLRVDGLAIFEQPLMRSRARLLRCRREQRGGQCSAKSFRNLELARFAVYRQACSRARNEFQKRLRKLSRSTIEAVGRAI